MRAEKGKEPNANIKGGKTEGWMPTGDHRAFVDHREYDGCRRRGVAAVKPGRHGDHERGVTAP
jgi:hypothetical protein